MFQIRERFPNMMHQLDGMAFGLLGLIEGPRA